MVPSYFVGRAERDGTFGATFAGIGVVDSKSRWTCSMAGAFGDSMKRFPLTTGIGCVAAAAAEQVRRCASRSGRRPVLAGSGGRRWDDAPLDIDPCLLQGRDDAVVLLPGNIRVGRAEWHIEPGPGRKPLSGVDLRDQM
jgi:hypothetical protein